VNNWFFDTTGEQIGRQHSANRKNGRNLSWAGMEQEKDMHAEVCAEWN